MVLPSRCLVDDLDHSIVVSTNHGLDFSNISPKELLTPVNFEDLDTLR